MPHGGPGPVRADVGAEAGNASLLRGFGRVAGPAGSGGYSAGASWQEEQHRIGDDRFRQLDVYGTADLQGLEAADLGLTGRFATGQQDDYPDASGGPVYGTGDLRHSEHQDLALGARLDAGDPAGRRQRLYAALSSAATSTARARPCRRSCRSPSSTRSTRGCRVGLAGAAAAHGPHRDRRRSLRRRRVGRQRERAPAASIPRRRDARQLPGDAVDRRGLRRRSCGSRARSLSRPRCEWTRPRPLRCRSTRTRASSGHSAPARPGCTSPAAAPRSCRASSPSPARAPSEATRTSCRSGCSGARPGLEHTFRGARLEAGATLLPPGLPRPHRLRLPAVPEREPRAGPHAGGRAHARWQPHPTSDGRRRGDVGRRPGPRRARVLLQQPRWYGRGAGDLAARRPGSACGCDGARRVSRYFDMQYPVPERDTVDGYGLLRLRRRPGGCGTASSLRARVRQPHRPELRDVHRLPGPGPVVLGRPRLEARLRRLSGSARGSSGSGTRVKARASS